MPKLSRLLQLLVLCPFLLQAQATKKVTEKQKNSVATEVYYVLKDNPSIKHGTYKKLMSSKAVILEGKYHLGQKDSVWTEYRLGIGTKYWQGSYEKGVKAGLWSYFDFTGNLVQQYNFSTGELVYYQEDAEEKKLKTYNLSDSAKVVPERPLLYIGGMPCMMAHISSTIEYPIEAREEGVSGKVYVSFIVNAYGVSDQHQVLNKVGYGFDAEALRVMKALPDQWLPAIVNGRPVATKIVMPISFKIQ